MKKGLSIPSHSKCMNVCMYDVQSHHGSYTRHARAMLQQYPSFKSQNWRLNNDQYARAMLQPCPSFKSQNWRLNNDRHARAMSQDNITLHSLWIYACANKTSISASRADSNNKSPEAKHAVPRSTSITIINWPLSCSCIAPPHTSQFTSRTHANT